MLKYIIIQLFILFFLFSTFIYLDFSGSFSFFLHGSTFLSILDAILDFPGNNKKASFFVSCINFVVSEICC